MLEANELKCFLTFTLILSAISCPIPQKWNGPLVVNGSCCQQNDEDGTIPQNNFSSW